MLLGRTARSKMETDQFWCDRQAEGYWDPVHVPLQGSSPGRGRSGESEGKFPPPRPSRKKAHEIFLSQKEEEKIARREAQRAENAAGTGATLASTAALAQALAADSQRHEDFLAEGGAFEDDEENMVADPSLRLHARSLRKVLEASDVLIEVLDARDPVGTRCRAVERELKSLDGGRKKLVLVLNKIGKPPPLALFEHL